MCVRSKTLNSSSSRHTTAVTGGKASPASRPATARGRRAGDAGIVNPSRYEERGIAATIIIITPGERLT